MQTHKQIILACALLYSTALFAEQAQQQYLRGISLYKEAIVQKDFKQALLLFEAAAKQNHLPAMDVAGVMHLKGIGSPSNIIVGEAWLEQACQKQHANACLHLGISKERRGDGLYYAQAKRAYEDAITYGNAEALKHLARMLTKQNSQSEKARRYASNLLTQADKTRPASPSVMHHTKQVENNTAAEKLEENKPQLPKTTEVITTTSGTIEEPLTHEYDMYATRDLLEPLCEGDRPWVCNDLANVLLDIGENVEAGKVERLYISSAASGNPAAIYNLAEWYLRSAPGRSEPNWKLGIHWLETAAKIGTIEAYELAADIARDFPDQASKVPDYLYKNSDWNMSEPEGDIVRVTQSTQTLKPHTNRSNTDYDLKQRINHLEVKLSTIASTQPNNKMTDVGSQRLGEDENRKGLVAYQNKNYIASLTHWLASAANGNTKAMFNLGKSYQYGLGTRQDPKEAERWFRRGAQIGHQASINTLAQLIQAKPQTQSNADDAAYWLARQPTPNNK